MDISRTRAGLERGLKLGLIADATRVIGQRAAQPFDAAVIGGLAALRRRRHGDLARRRDGDLDALRGATAPGQPDQDQSERDRPIEPAHGIHPRGVLRSVIGGRRHWRRRGPALLP